MMLHSVRIGIYDVPCVDLEAVIIHGRGSVTDGPTASSATITAYMQRMPAWMVGDSVEIWVDDPPVRRFRGTVTDINLAGHDDRLGAILEVDCTGYLALLGWRVIGDVPWPVETPRARAERILTAANVTYVAADRSMVLVNARDVDRKDALGLLGELAADTGAAVFDDPDGVIHFQHYSSRAETWRFTRWRDLPDDLDWPGWGTGWGGMGEAWEQTETTSPAAPLPLRIDGCAVLWEPAWTSTSGSIINSVTVEYGPEVDGGDRPSISLDRPRSIARFGRQHVDGPKELADAASAYQRATMILDLHSQPQWALGSVVVLLDKVQSTLPFLNLRCGARVQIIGMPQPAPDIDPVMIVEGWTHNLGAQRDTLELRLSHPAHSYAGMVWETLPANPPPRWLDIDPTIIWVDALTPEDLTLI